MHVGRDRTRKSDKVHVVTGTIDWGDEAPKDVKRFNKIQLKNPEDEKKPDEFYHYTTPKGLEQIKSSGHLLSPNSETYLAPSPHQAFAYANKQGHREVELLKVHGSENVRGPYGSDIYKSEEKIPLSRIEVLGHFKENPKTGRWDRVD